ncbi:MAG: phosphoglucomutase/phosphomannomutase family protein [Candidatus Omnitrophica bacterium]|nr:phosphoglucomutase/phosphomannomutase family protein [Candidatus Omnitrophota bacterium]MDD5352722.1 phosphoglucomutase/phosphomannomutase family protein [Candidatus Omnitrophota bacterium]MDD5550321.1 phosphoglucomutase/phosphomannomutase family protein [Candidatus Omnitrophota bacterium]
MSKNSIKEKIKFGTDGWRAVIADTFTFENLKIVSQATADFLKSSQAKSKNKKLNIAVGYDTRFMSENFAEIVACVFAANGINVILSDRLTPTPTISFAVKTRKLDLGIMITASHNPPEFNGFKIKSHTGGSADISVTKKVEKLLCKNKPRFMPLSQALEKKLITKENIISDYIKFLRSYLDLDRLKNSRFKVLLDCMYGSGNGYMREVIAGTAIDLEIMRSERNTYFEGKGPEPVKQNLSKIIGRMKNENFDLGLVLDGDADRIAAVASGGEFIHPQKILGLLALHLKEDRLLSGGIVKTVAGTTMIDHIAKYLGLKLHETPVGFKYISHLMEKEDILVGGEEAGGMGFKNYVPERDGTLAGLLLLEMMVYRNKNIKDIVSEMEDRFGRYHYLREDLKLKPGRKMKDVKTIRPKTLLDSKVVKITDIDGIKLFCEDESWLMLRPSGTEPLMRIYAEAKSHEKATNLLNLGKTLVLK